MRATSTDARALAARRGIRWGLGLLLVSASLAGLSTALGADDEMPSAAGGALPPPVSARTGFQRAVMIPIHDEINDVTFASVQRRINDAKSRHADLIIFDLDTPGGVAKVALDICTAIKNLTSVHTVAWINPDAYSAGAIIALSCDEIIMSGRSKMGDAQPIFYGPEGVSAIPEDVRAKAYSPLLEEVESSARRHGYDRDLCLSMMLPDMELFWVENTKTGERRFVQPAVRDRLFGLVEQPVPGTARPNDTTSDSDAKNASKSTRDKRTEPVPDSLSKTDWRYVKSAPPLTSVRQPIVGSDELLMMGEDAAVAYGFAKGIVSSEDEMRDFYGIHGPIELLKYSWSEQLVDVLSSPIVRGILFIMMLLGAYVEFSTPGFGIPGIVALTCLVLFLGAPYLTGLAQAWEILVVVCGVGLLMVEVFVIPGFGVVGIAGLVLIFVGIVATFMPHEPGPIHWPTFRYTVEGVQTGLAVVAVGLVAAIVGMFALSRYMPRTPYFRRIVPPNPTPESIAIVDPLGNLASIGDVGTAVGPLRPAGKARFGASLVDVVSDGEFINAGDRIEVIDRQGNRVVVRRARA